MPLTTFQERVALLLAGSRSEDSYLAGGAAIHLAPTSTRYSNDLDYFHDSQERVAKAFHDDEKALTAKGFHVAVDIAQPGYIRAQVSKKRDATKVEWSHDTAWRFMPTIADERVGWILDEVDLAINKVLALAGRQEARDFFDVMHLHQHVLPLGAMCWAGAGKDPGFTPATLLGLLQRRGQVRPDDVRRLHLIAPVDLNELKTQWLSALDDAEQFIARQPKDEVGCLYYDVDQERFVQPEDGDTAVPHYGRPGGVLPQLC